jgi:hypothetical protein
MHPSADSEHGPAAVAPSTVRYIKLGPSGRWFDRCIDDGVVELGHQEIPHGVANAGDWEAAERIWLGAGRSPGKAKDFRRELQDFYTLPEDALWITFGAGRLWWCFARAAVEPLEPDNSSSHGARQRRAIGGWRSVDTAGTPLLMDRLSTRLTQVGAYRQTLCRVEASSYLIRRINAEIEPAVAAAEAARAATLKAASDLIQNLHWADFEVMVDLIFAASGWRRAGAVGGSSQADTDLILEQAATGERAFVQVKSKASPVVLADYLERFRASGMDRMFFTVHSPSSALALPADAAGVHLWQGEEVAAQAVKAGLLDWLIDKAS